MPRFGGFASVGRGSFQLFEGFTASSGTFEHDAELLVELNPHKSSSDDTKNWNYILNCVWKKKEKKKKRQTSDISLDLDFIENIDKLDTLHQSGMKWQIL